MNDINIMKISGRLILDGMKPDRLTVPLGFQRVTAHLAPDEVTDIRAEVELDIDFINGAAELRFYGVGSSEAQFSLPLEECKWPSASMLALGYRTDGQGEFLPPHHWSEGQTEDGEE
jgi:hypothetical protein